MSDFGGKADIQLVRHDVRFWHKADMSGSGLVLRKMTDKPYFAGLKSLL